MATRRKHGSSSDAKPDISLRPSTAADLSTMAEISAEAFYDSPFTSKMHPYREKYRAEYTRSYYQPAALRWANPRVETWVAEANPPSSPRVIVGFIQFARIGTSASVEAQVARRRQRDGYIYLVLLGWWFWILISLQQRFMPNRAEDPAVRKVMLGEGRSAMGKYWKKWPERWYVHHLVVLPEWQGRAIGRRLMEKAVERGDEDGVVLVLASSPVGEGLYKSLGFELVSRFATAISDDAIDAGGWFVREPKGKRVEQENGGL